MPLGPGQELLHYRITEKIGEGGMGVVYRAEDTRLGRPIAIKVLSAQLSQNQDRRRRFENEARVVAALKHPNIVTIYSVEESRGLHFITMELIEGRSLSNLIPDGGLELSRLFELAIPAAEALSSAHAKGITHRDLKPGNIMVDADGRVKVLDFGLAKLLVPEAEGDAARSILATATHTEEGKILGTAAYMSPEQAEGKSVDHRSDIFSFGIVLYEMATGTRPFQGDTAISTVSSILKDQPPRVSDLKPALPRHLGRIIDRCLEKNPDKRFQTARDVVNELEGLKKEIDSGPLAPTARARPRWLLPVAGIALVALVALGAIWWMQRDSRPASPADAPSAATGGAAREMIAVLPFENLGPAEDAYFAAGVTDEIIGRLSGISGLGVISRTSVTQYDRTGKTLRQVGEDLGVSYVLEGTVRWARSTEGQGRVRITPQLVRVSDDSQLWAETYDQQIDDIFEVQSRIAGEVIAQLGVTLMRGERAALDDRPTDNVEAYQAFLRGMKPPQGLGIAEWDRVSTENFERATQLDPGFQDAWAHLSRHHSVFYHLNFDRTPARLDRAKQAMERAVEIDPAHPSALLARGYYHYFGFREYERALEDFRAALALRPNDSDVQSAIGYIHRRRGEWDEAIEALEAALELAPRDRIVLDNLSETYRARRDFDRAIEVRRRLIELHPEDVESRLDLATYTVLATGDLSRGKEIWRATPSSEGLSRAIGCYTFARWEREFDRACECAESIEADSPMMQIIVGSFVAHCKFERDGLGTARESLEASARQIEEMLESEPGNVALRRQLGWTHARLGKADAAIRESRLAVELSAKDRFDGPDAEETLAAVYAALGRNDEALELVERLLETVYTNSLTVTELRLDPTWDPLREDPDFRKLVGE